MSWHIFWEEIDSGAGIVSETSESSAMQKFTVRTHGGGKSVAASGPPAAVSLWETSIISEAGDIRVAVAVNSDLEGLVVAVAAEKVLD